MTEAMWLACENPTAMLRALSEAASNRKLQLFAVTCCRRVQRYDEKTLELEDAEFYIAVLERIADGAGSAAEWADALLRLESTNHDIIDRTLEAPSANFRAFFCAIDDDPHRAARLASANANIALSHPHRPEADELAGPAESKIQASLLRDIFGNPFRVASFSSEWRTDTVISLAAQMYESRDFGAMPILADALQDAGCADAADILDHCRGLGPHVRGCWVVDLVLGKE